MSLLWVITAGLLKTILSLAPMKGFDADFDLVIEQDGSGQSDGPHARFILYTDSALWHQLMTTTKDLQLKLLRWYLCLKKFNFMVRDKPIHSPIQT